MYVCDIIALKLLNRLLLLLFCLKDTQATFRPINERFSSIESKNQKRSQGLVIRFKSILTLWLNETVQNPIAVLPAKHRRRTQINVSLTTISILINSTQLNFANYRFIEYQFLLAASLAQPTVQIILNSQFVRPKANRKPLASIQGV